jgi:hypothetical protein
MRWAGDKGSRQPGRTGPGTALTVDAVGFAPNETVTIAFGDGPAVLTVKANADGVVSAASFSVPATVPVPGVTSIRLTGADSKIRAEVPFTATF